MAHSRLWYSEATVSCFVARRNRHMELGCLVINNATMIRTWLLLPMPLRHRADASNVWECAESTQTRGVSRPRRHAHTYIQRLEGKSPNSISPMPAKINTKNAVFFGAQEKITIWMRTLVCCTEYRTFAQLAHFRERLHTFYMRTSRHTRKKIHYWYRRASNVTI